MQGCAQEEIGEAELPGAEETFESSMATREEPGVGKVPGTGVAGKRVAEGGKVLYCIYWCCIVSCGGLVGLAWSSRGDAGSTSYCGRYI